MTQTQPIAIVFADVSNSTRLFEERGDVEARRIISGVIDALMEIVKRNGGTVIKTIGDEVMCTFPAAIDAIMAACQMQRRVTQDPTFVRDSLGIRVGLHHGEALLENGDVFGDAVNTAARMASLAKRDQIVTTASTFRETTSVGSMRARSLGRTRVRGKLLPIEIVDVIWQEDTSGVTMVQRAIRVDEPTEEGQKLTLRIRGQVIELSPTSPAFSMGRDASNALVVDSEWVSRIHASIEFKNGHYMLADHSTNATYVQFANDEELRVHRDEVHLRKSGAVSLGQSLAAGSPDILYFQCS